MKLFRRLNQNNLTKIKLNKRNVKFPFNIKLSDLDILLKDYRKLVVIKFMINHKLVWQWFMG